MPYARKRGSNLIGGSKRISLTVDGKFAIAEYKQGNADYRVLSAGLDDLLSFKRSLAASVKEYWERIFIWPMERLRTDSNSLAFVMPAVPPEFYVKSSDCRNSDDGMVKENVLHSQKEAAEFTSIWRFYTYTPVAHGSFSNYFRMCAHIARSIRFINRWGRSYGDISLRNILMNPSMARVLFIDMDNMTINRAKGRTTAGTAGYLAPEIYFDNERATSKTDDFSLAVMLYKILHLRHPFAGNPFGQDGEVQGKDENGKCSCDKEHFVYIESSPNCINRYAKADVLAYAERDSKYRRLLPYCLPWFDLDALPSRKVVGEKMSELFRKTFVDYLYDPDNRPTAEEWEKQLIRTEGRLLPCSNLDCPAGSFVWDESNYDRKRNRFVCPFCGNTLTEPVLTIAVREHSDDRRWKWRIVTTSTKTRPLLRWELGGFLASDRSRLMGDQLEDESLLEPVAEIYYSGGCFNLRNQSGGDLIYVRSGEKKILSTGAAIALIKDDYFRKIDNRVFHVLGVIG